MPRTTRPVLASGRTPTSLRPATTTSFGCRSVASTPVSARSAAATASPATSESSGQSGIGASGAAAPRTGASVPGTSSDAPSRPRPAVWWSVTTVAPSGSSSPSSAASTRTTRRSDTASRAARRAAAARLGAQVRHSRLRLARRAESRPIRLQLRRDGGLAYEKLSDPILVQRSKDGEPRARDAAGTACAEGRAARAAVPARSRGRERRRTGGAREGLRAPEQFRGGSQFSTWLHRLVVNTCLDAAERRKARVHEPLGEHLQSGRRSGARRGQLRAPARALRTRSPGSRRSRRRSSS